MQEDLFGETLEKKILRMERWILRLQKEVWFLKEVYKLSEAKKAKAPAAPSEKVYQLDIFSALP